jgi:hypothetical protein
MLKVGHMKKRIFVALASLLVSTAAQAQVHVKGYVTKNGTYVAPHYRSSPNSTKLDNYSTKGNINPYTGQVGTRNVYSNPYNFGSSGSSSSSSYSSYGSSDSYGSYRESGDSESDPE